MSWTVPNDVTDSWVGENAPTDAGRLQIWIDRAERMVRRRVPDLQARIDSEADATPPVTDLLETAKDIVVAMVTEVFKNPDGKRSTSSSTGPFGDNVTFAGDNPGKLALTSDQEDQLSGSRKGEAFTVDLMSPTVPAVTFERGGG